MPKVSVVVPAYNAQKYITETLDCLRDQTLRDIEVLVVNDGSTDNTEKIVSAYCEKDKRFSLINQQNGGVSRARNNGLHKATGEYILFLDSDDLLTEESLESFADSLDRTGADVSIGRLQSFGEVEEKFNGFAESLSKCEKIDKFNKTLLWNFLVGNKCYRLKTLLDSGVEFPTIGYSEEGAFFMEFVLSDKIKNITGTDKACMKYRRHDPAKEASVSQRITKKLIMDFLCAIERIYSAAEKALVNETLEKKEDYLQEILYKGDYVLISQFYRLLWQADDEMMAVIEAGHNRYLDKMTNATKGKVERLNADLGTLVFDKKELAKSPKVSVILSFSDVADTLSSIYMQTFPLFEVFVRESAKENVPERWISCPNLHVLNDADFMSAAKAMARAKILKIRRPHKADPRIMRFIERLPIPEKIKSMSYTMIFKAVETAVRIKSDG